MVVGRRRALSSESWSADRQSGRPRMAEVLLTGVGGQGIELVFRTLALAEVAEGWHAMMVGNYGGSIRAGVTEGTVVGWSNLLQHWQTNPALHYTHAALPELLLGTVDRHRTMSLYCIPWIWQGILASGYLERFDASSLRQVNTGTSAASLELLSELNARFPRTTTAIGYGSTEGGAGAHLDDDGLFDKPGGGTAEQVPAAAPRRRRDPNEVDRSTSNARTPRSRSSSMAVTTPATAAVWTTRGARRSWAESGRSSIRAASGSLWLRSQNLYAALRVSARLPCSGCPTSCGVRS